MYTYRQHEDLLAHSMRQNSDNLMLQYNARGVMFAETLTMLPYISFSYTDYVWLEIMLISSSDCKNASILP